MRPPGAPKERPEYRLGCIHKDRAVRDPTSAAKRSGSEADVLIGASSARPWCGQANAGLFLSGLPNLISIGLHPDHRGVDETRRRRRAPCHGLSERKRRDRGVVDLLVTGQIE